MNPDGPMVAVCVAPTDLRPEVDGLTGAVRADLRRSDLTAAEAAAVEHAFRVAEAWEGHVLAVAAGPAEIDGVLRELRSLGAEVVRVDTAPHSPPVDPSFDPPSDLAADPPGPAPVAAGDLAGDPVAIAAALAAAIRSYGEPAVVLCGDRSGGQGVGAVPALLAHELGVDQALGLVSIAVADREQLLVERRLDGGWRERLAVTGPAVLSVEGAGVRLRRASLEAALSVEDHPIRSDPASSSPRTAADLRVGSVRTYRPRTRPVPPPTGDPHERLLALTGALSVREPARVVGPVDADRAVGELLDYLRRFGYAP